MTDAGRSLAAAVDAMGDLRVTLLNGTGTERVTLEELAGRVLAAEVVADGDVPPHSTATMDGVALDTGEDPPLDISGEALAPGDDPPDHEPGTARRVATGAPVPVGTDAVVPREELLADDGRLTAVPVDSGDHRIRRGSVVAAGETVLREGRRLAPRDAPLLADLGRESVAVRERLSAAVLATGTEIHAGREPDRDSAFLANLVREWGGAATLAGSVPDDPDVVGDRVADLGRDHDVVLTTGGTGVSGRDETRETLGAQTEVRVSDVPVRPGSNTTVALLADSESVVVSLPGPPGAAFASATLLARPLFVGRSHSPTVAGTMTCDLPVPDRDLTFVVPVEMRNGSAESRDESGVPRIVPFGHPTSTVELYPDRFRPHRVATCARLSAADGFVLTGESLTEGERVAVRPYSVVES
jgi:molybdopterin molybdotransferase